MGIKKSHTTAYHPQGDRQVERQNRTLQEIIANFVSENHAEYMRQQDSLPMSQSLVVPFACLQSQNQDSPFLTHSASQDIGYSNYLGKAIQTANSLARRQLEKSRKQQCVSYDKGHKSWSPFETGQAVWLRCPKSWNFRNKWVWRYNSTSTKGVNFKIHQKNQACMHKISWTTSILLNVD